MGTSSGDVNGDADVTNGNGNLGGGDRDLWSRGLPFYFLSVMSDFLLP